MYEHRLRHILGGAIKVIWINLMLLLSLVGPVSGALSQDTVAGSRKPIGITLKAYTTVCHNLTQGIKVVQAAIGDYSPNSHFTVGLGMETSTAGPQAAVLRWSAGFDVGKVFIFFENRELLNIYFRTHIKEFDVVELAGISTKHWRVAAGVGQRLITRDKMLDTKHSADFVLEPFNLMYELEYHVRLGRTEQWGLAVRVADFDDFVADRAFQPMLSIGTSRKISDTFDIWCRATVHPTGIFNVSVSYYEFFVNIGIVKKW